MFHLWSDTTSALTVFLNMHTAVKLRFELNQVNISVRGNINTNFFPSLCPSVSLYNQCAYILLRWNDIELPLNLYAFLTSMYLSVCWPACLSTQSSPFNLFCLIVCLSYFWNKILMGTFKNHLFTPNQGSDHKRNISSKLTDILHSLFLHFLAEICSVHWFCWEEYTVKGCGFKTRF